ncbi:MAG: fimbrillin family protein, partial [Alistipes sp.]|nr:fimbrillin family protein [Alistipes sp.]
DTYARTATITSTAMAKGMSYDIKTTLTAQNTSDDGQLWPIEFTVTEVEEWKDYTNVNGAVNQPTTGN